MGFPVMPSPREVDVRQDACHRANQEGRRGKDFADDETTEGVADGTGHYPPYAVFEAPVKRSGRKSCDPAGKEAKVVKSPKVLKTGVNSPVTARIYA
jgi:hypothetical protein